MTIYMCEKSKIPEMSEETKLAEKLIMSKELKMLKKLNVNHVICVTNRKLCKEDFLVRIEKLAKADPAGIILREKDLTEEEYKNLAQEVIKICDMYGVKCILHSFTNVAKELDCKMIHMPLHVLRTMTSEDKAEFTAIGASCHSVEEAKEAEELGCTYIIAGHIFDTDCKKGLPGRGVDFLQQVCESVSIPVYAIGGIEKGNISQVRNAGAKGACIMSGAMTCEDVEEYLLLGTENTEGGR